MCIALLLYLKVSDLSHKKTYVTSRVAGSAKADLAADRFASSNVETAWWSFFFGRVRRFTDEQTRARPSWQSVITRRTAERA